MEIMHQFADLRSKIESNIYPNDDSVENNEQGIQGNVISDPAASNPLNAHDANRLDQLRAQLL